MSDRSDFVPPDYEPPKKSGKFMKLKLGENTIRILDSPLIGEEGWRDRAGKREPVRKPVGAIWKAGEFTAKDRQPIKHFWALPVWNYAESRIQVLEITQTTIIEAIKTLSRNKKWGHPAHYDLLIHAKGDGMDREYAVMPEPKGPLATEARIAWDEAQRNGFDLSRLFENGDPFNEDGDTRPAATTTNTDEEYDEQNPPPAEDADVPF